MALALIHTVIVAAVTWAALLRAGGRNAPWGVSVPPGHADDPVIRSWRSRYRTGVLAVGIGAVAGVWAVAQTGRTLLVLGVVLVQLLLVMALFASANRAVRQVKAEQQWYAHVRQGLAVDTSLATRPERFPWRWAIPALAVAAASLVVGIARYRHLPATLPVHFTATGTVNRTAHTTVLTAFMPVGAQALLTAVLWGFALKAVRGEAGIDPADPEGSARQGRSYAAVMARSLLFLAALINLAMFFVAMQMWHVFTLAVGNVVLAEIALGVGVLGVVVATARHPLPQAPATAGTHSGTGLVARDEDSHWHLGFLYANRTDPSVLVPRRLGIGWTPNFGNPFAWITTIGALALVCALVVIAALR